MKKLLLTTALVAAAVATYANSEMVFAKPNMHSKQLGVISESNAHTVVPFFKKGNWVKVASTASGQVGWVYAGPCHQVEQANAKKANQLHAIQQQRLYYRELHQKMNEEFAQLDHAFAQQADQIQMQSQAENQQIQQAVAHSKNQHEAFKSVSVQYNNASKDAIVIKKWLGKDGKMHILKKEVPLAALQNQNPGLVQPQNQQGKISW